jgi:hypothetical protein
MEFILSSVYSDVNEKSKFDRGPVVDPHLVHLYNDCISGRCEGMQMENVSDPTTSVLMTHRLSASMLRLLYIRFAGISSIAFLFTLIVVLCGLSPAYFAVPAALVLLLKFEARATVVRFTCTASGMEIDRLAGPKETVKWPEIQAFIRRSIFKRRYAALIARNHPQLNFYELSEEVLNGLVAILRETSNARIVGFDGYR